MTTPYICLGCAVIVPTGGLALAWSAVARASDATTQALSGTATLTAGTYSPDGFINHAASKLRTSVFAQITAAAFFTTKPVNAAAVPLKIGMPAAGPSAGIGTTPLRFVMATTGGAKAGVNLATTWQSFSLVNSSDSWCTLGLAYPGQTRALTIVGAGPDDTGLAQPRWLFFLRASFQDTGDLITFPNYYSHNTGSRVRSWSGFEPNQNRTLRLVTQNQALIGPPWHIARFSQFANATTERESLTYLTLDESLFTGMSGMDVNTAFLTSPVYLRAGRYWARYRDTNSGSLRMMEPWPALITPVSGQTIQAYSEGYAMIEEWVRTGLLFRYDPIDATGVTAWTWQAYAPNVQGPWNVDCARVGNSLFYTLELPCKLVEDPELAVP